MGPEGSASSMSPTMSTFACVRCSERKVRCDKSTPCNTCIRHEVECIYRAPKPPRRKRRVTKDTLVAEQLKRYELLLRENDIDPDQAPGTQTSSLATDEALCKLPTPASTVSEPQATLFTPQLIQGPRGTKLVDNSLWSRVAEEVHDSEEDPEDDLVSDSSGLQVSTNDFGYVLDWKRPGTVQAHPPAEKIHQLWQIFVENVNPLSKLIHVPTLQPAIERAVANIERIPKGFEALMFSIYSMAVLSLSHDECREIMGDSRSRLLARYVDATKAALTRARFMSSSSIVVLQALVLHILSIRDASEPRAVWTLTGVALRVAEGMGMRLDGTFLGLSPFETEIRRRIWWQLRMHDFRAAELCGQAKFRDFGFDETTPKQPANVDDADLYPTMPQAPVESTRLTEMIWCAFRSELINFAASQKDKLTPRRKSTFTSEEYIAMDDLKGKDEVIKRIEDMLETKYLRFCDPSQPLQLMTLLGARASANLIRFLSHHPRRWAHMDHVPEAEQEMVWNIAIQLLEQYDMMQSNPQLRRFAWNVPYYIQWHAVIHVLDTLRADPLASQASKAWRLIDKMYANNSEMLLDIHRPIFAAVGNLCLKAFRARVSALAMKKKEKGEASSLPDDGAVAPEYIVKLRQQRKEAKARRDAAMAGARGQDARVGGAGVGEIQSTTITSTPPYPAAAAAAAAAATAAANSAPVESAAPSYFYPVVRDLAQGRDDDAFWLTGTGGDDNDSDTGVFFAAATTATNNDDPTTMMMNIDPSWLDTDTPSLDSGGRGTDAAAQIDWAQWDAWMGAESGSGSTLRNGFLSDPGWSTPAVQP